MALFRGRCIGHKLAFASKTRVVIQSHNIATLANLEKCLARK